MKSEFQQPPKKKKKKTVLAGMSFYLFNAGFYSLVPVKTCIGFKVLFCVNGYCVSFF